MFKTYQFTDNPLDDPVKCGEGKFLVFPCPSPMTNDGPSTSKEQDICYNYATQIAINRLLTEEQLYVNVGHVQISALLKIDQNQGNCLGALKLQFEIWWEGVIKVTGVQIGA